jgi:competence protein ComEA
VPAITLTRRTALLFAAAAIAVVLVAARLAAPGAKPAVSVESAIAAGTPDAATAPARPRSGAIVVDVAGAVRKPGLYRLRAGARIADALAVAGGATPHADAAAVNLAEPLVDGEQVLVPARAGRGADVSAIAGVPGAPPAPVDLNTATVDQLDALPGIGPVTAAKIVAYRRAHGPFRSLAALDAIPGIGPARIENLKGLVVQR